MRKSRQNCHAPVQRTSYSSPLCVNGMVAIIDFIGSDWAMIAVLKYGL